MTLQYIVTICSIGHECVFAYTLSCMHVHMNTRPIMAHSGPLVAVKF